MDMWDPYITSTRQHLEDADDKIVFDRYHLMAYLTKAVDTVRKQENRALVTTGDKSLSERSICGSTQLRTSPIVTRTASQSCEVAT